MRRSDAEPEARLGIRCEALAIGHRRRRRTTTVAAGLDAVAAPGELTVLLGPNGAGKTTLLRTVCGLLPALGGRVLVDGRALGDLDARARAREVAAVLTGARPPATLGVRDLVMLGRHPYLPAMTARPGPGDDDAVSAALERVGATALATRRVGELSDGERQRVLLARALAQDTPVLVLDEPTAFLDAPGRRALVTLLAELAHGSHSGPGRTVLLCTHEVDLALTHADHGWLLDAEGVLHTGPPGALPRL